jgi:hypothetical protein
MRRRRESALVLCVCLLALMGKTVQGKPGKGGRGGGGGEKK